jgi:TatD DNase family protein
MIDTRTVGDAHCHLSDLEDPDGSVDAARAAGVGPILAVAMDAADGDRILALKDRHPDLIVAGVGLHPSRVPELDDEAVAAELARIEEQSRRADFIGEIGLDYRDAPDPPQQERQRKVLNTLLATAERRRLAVNLHTRRADRELLETAIAFTRRTGLGALLHWFTHSPKLARRCGAAGVFISAGPSIELDPKQLEVAREIAADFLLVETDSPVTYGGTAAQPAWAARLAGALARIRGRHPEAMRESLANNLRRFLGEDLNL